MRSSLATSRPCSQISGCASRSVGGKRDFSKAQELQKAVWEVFHSWNKNAVANGSKSLPLLWHVLSTAEGTGFKRPPGHKPVGTAGGYAHARFCWWVCSRALPLRTLAIYGWVLLIGFVVVWVVLVQYCRGLLVPCLSVLLYISTVHSSTHGLLLQQPRSTCPDTFYYVYPCMLCSHLWSASQLQSSAGVPVPLLVWRVQQAQMHSISREATTAGFSPASELHLGFQSALYPSASGPMSCMPAGLQEGPAICKASQPVVCPLSTNVRT